MKLFISIRSCTVLVGGKNFSKNFCARSFHVLMEVGGSEFNHYFALSLSENGNR